MYNIICLWGAVEFTAPFLVSVLNEFEPPGEE